VTIDLSEEEEEDLNELKETTGRIQLWGRNRSFIGLTSWSEEEDAARPTGFAVLVMLPFFVAMEKNLII